MFYQIKEVHGMLAGLTFLLVILSDLYGLSWVLGIQKFLNSKVLNFLHKVVFLSLGILILSGLSMVILQSEEFLLNIVFWAKMFFVTVLFWNAFRIGKEVELPSVKMFTSLSASEKKHMLIVGFTSIVSWVSALVLAQLL